MERTKYPRTMNFPWSGSESSDDVWWGDCSAFEGKDVVVTEKLDGECTTIYRDGHVHARSIDTSHHPSRSWVKQLAARIAHEIPETWRVCGENVFAYHSIFYTELPSYFFVYGIYDGPQCLPWSDVEEFCELVDLETVPVMYKGPWDEEHIKNLWTGKGAFPTFREVEHDNPVPVFPDNFSESNAEGYVVRVQDGFPHAKFKEHCAKYVVPNHVQTPTNWMTRPVVPNLLK